MNTEDIANMNTEDIAKQYNTLRELLWDLPPEPRHRWQQELKSELGGQWNYEALRTAIEAEIGLRNRD